MTTKEKLLPLRKMPAYPITDSLLHGRKVRYPTEPGREYQIIRVFGNIRNRNQTPEGLDWNKPANLKNPPSVSCEIARVLPDGTLGRLEQTYVRLAYIVQPDGKTRIEQLLEEGTCIE